MDILCLSHFSQLALDRTRCKVLKTSRCWKWTEPNSLLVLYQCPTGLSTFSLWKISSVRLAFNRTTIATVRGKTTLFTLGGKFPQSLSSNGKSFRWNSGLEHQQPNSPVVTANAHFGSSDPVVSAAASLWQNLSQPVTESAHSIGHYCGLQFSTSTNRKGTTVLHLVLSQEHEGHGSVRAGAAHIPVALSRSRHRSKPQLIQSVKE